MVPLPDLRIALSVVVVIVLAFLVRNWLISIPIVLGITMAGIDAVSLPMLKTIHDSPGISAGWILVPLMLYAAQPLLFYEALDYTSMTNMNMLWDVTSDVAVTALGLWWFREHISRKQGLGILFGVVAVGLLGSDSFRQQSAGLARGSN